MSEQPLTEEQLVDTSRCAICGGTKAEHVGRQHAFTLVAGDLKTHAEAAEQKASEQRKNGPGQGQGMVVVGQPPHRDTADRLVSLLIDKEIITQDEALYVLLGRRPAT